MSSSKCLNCNKKPKIAIIGAGLVGSLAAIELGRAGYEVDLYEFRDNIRTTKAPMGRNIILEVSDRGIAALKDVGLDHVLLKGCLPMKGRIIIDRKGNMQKKVYDERKDHTIYSVNRKFLNEILLTAVEETKNVHIYFNHKLIESNLKDGELQFMHTIEKKVVSRSADLILGADGAFSSVRKQMMRMPGFNFQQTYIDHGYKELQIPANEDGTSKLDQNFNHMYLRENCMINVSPDANQSWAITLVMSFEIFESIVTATDLLDFFRENFPGLIELIGEEVLIKDYFKNKPNHLIQVKCKPFDAFNRVLIIGDAAHAMLPFYGQGINAGLEDVSLLMKTLKNCKDNISHALKEFSRIRQEDTHAMSDETMDNYDKLKRNGPRYWTSLRNYFDDLMFHQFGDKWMPLYNAVTFSRLPYRQCVAFRKRQDKILMNTGIGLGALLVILPFVYMLILVKMVC